MKLLALTFLAAFAGCNASLRGTPILQPTLSLGRDHGLSVGGPVHASCHIQIDFNSTSCADVATALKKAGDAMSDFKCTGPKGNGEKCGYAITTATAAEVKGTHKTPVHKYTDDISFALSGSGAGCSAKAFSTSETWYAVLDQGTNYCNLHNLVAATGLAFGETTSDSICTQYSSHDCSKF